MFPSHGSTVWRPLPSPGSGRWPFPRFAGTRGRSDARSPLARRSVAFASRYHGVRLCSSLLPARRRLEAWGFRVWQPRANRCPWRRPGLPGSWGTLVSLCRVLRPRQDRTHQAAAVCRRGPRYVHDEGSCDTYLSRLNGTAGGLAVYASPGRLPGRDARLASGGWPSATGRDWLPAGFRRKVSPMESLHPIPLSQASPGARTSSNPT